MKSSVCTITIPVPAILSRAVSRSVTFSKEMRAILPAAVSGSLPNLRLGTGDFLEQIMDGANDRPSSTIRGSVGKRSSTARWLRTEYIPFLLSLAGLAALAFFLAMRNHRYAERGPRRLLRQITAFAAYEAVAAALITMFWNWYSWLH